jgi:ABC-2 type transport system permease protein
MIRTYRAELLKLARPKVLLVTAALVLAVGVGGAAIVLAAAEPAAESFGGRGPTIEGLSGAGGGTAVFRDVTSFAGTFLFVVFVALVAIEFSRGTIRTMLLRQPRRVRLLVGKVAGLITYAAGALAGTLVVTWIAARAIAPGQGVATDRWMSLTSLSSAVTDYGAVLAWVVGYAVLATMVAVAFRSLPLALGVGIAWAGPIEHLLQDAWEPANKLFPGLLLEAFVAGGTTLVSSGRALATAAAYVVVAAVVALTVFSRRDVTA